jgi:1-acyl-sn-glycerol-3-phosphate acyltransferase
MEKSAQRLEVLKKIEEYEKKSLWHLDVEDDPETYPLFPEMVDYLNKKFSSKIKNRFANFCAVRFYEKMIKNKRLIIKEVRGIENFLAVDGGKFITCNHFSVCDNYAVWKALKKHMSGRMLYKVIREGNYTNPPKGFGLFMRHCNTLPLSSKSATMKKFLGAVGVLIERGESILIYPEQAMWWNYKKPRPLQEGAFSLALRYNAPIVPIFITMEDSDIQDGDGFFVQEYTINILPAIYPDKNIPQRSAKEKMKQQNYDCWVRVYEEFYNKKLEYDNRRI